MICHSSQNADSKSHYLLLRILSTYNAMTRRKWGFGEVCSAYVNAQNILKYASNHSLHTADTQGISKLVGLNQEEGNRSRKLCK
jgi:hypothetical protein